MDETKATTHWKLKTLPFWIVVAVGYFSVTGAWISVRTADKDFTDYMGYVVNLAGREHRPAKELRSLLLVKADDLAIPLDGEDIQITGEGKTLRTIVTYETDLRLPLVNRKIYRMKFSHDISYNPAL